MEDYTNANVIFFLFNLLSFLIAYLYYDMKKIEGEACDQNETKATVIYIFSQAFLGIALGSIILFAGLPVIGKILTEISETFQFDKAISEEESFLINFCITFGFIFMFLFNKVLQEGWAAIRLGFKNAIKHDVTK